MILFFFWTEQVLCTELKRGDALIFENLFNSLDNFHLKRVIEYLNKYNIKNLIDVGAHKGEFLN